jgi:hypothetical protein
MGRTVRDIHRDVVLGEWLEAVDQTVAALRRFRAKLEGWRNGDGDGCLDAALAELDAQNLSEWAEWVPAAGGLDALVEVLAENWTTTGGPPKVHRLFPDTPGA